METIENTEIGAAILDDVAAFIRRYLVCDDHQLTILTLWTASPYCYECFSVAPYLNVRSPEPHSGKSLCLDLLSDLCDPVIFLGGMPPGTLIQRFVTGRCFQETANKEEEEMIPSFTILLDDCHNTFGPSDRQPIIGLLNSGSEIDGLFGVGALDYNFFGPKAFAGNNPLPRSLAARCIPIVLRRPRPSETFARYNSGDLRDTTEALTARLKQWLQQTEETKFAIFLAAKKAPANLPLMLSPGQRKCAEPLIHIADAAGGSWPARIRAALPAAFDLSDASPQLQMLWDLRSIFRDMNNPEYLATSDLLSALRSMDDRPWSAWGPKSGKRLAGHLRPFGIVPQHLNRGSEGDFRAYLAKDFQDAWDRYLPPSSASAESEISAIVHDGNGAPDGSKIFPVTGISAIGAGSDRMTE
jgi:Protein of unknown function (DUF3631)